MKATNWLFIVLSIAAVFEGSGQTDRLLEEAREGSKAADGYSIIARDAHSRVWAKVSYETNRLGEISAQTNAYTELTTSMHFLRDGQWVETTPEISLVADGAAATNMAYQVFFPANVSGAVTLISPDAKQFRSRIFGLSFFNGTNAVLIAEIRESTGLLFPPNRVVYTNAFDNADGVEADVEYVVTKAGLEQNVIIRRLPSASEFNLSGNVRVQLLSEFYAAPVPEKRTLVEAGGLRDEFLDFGNMQMAPGRGFAVGDDAESEKSIRVFKQWTEMEGRTFLVEEVPLALVEKHIQAQERKRQGASLNRNRQGTGDNVIVALKDVLPAHKPKPATGTMRLAKLEPQRRGFLLDYTLLTSQTNTTLTCDKTFFVSGLVNLSASGAGGATTLEATVIKFTNHPSAKISISGPLVCQTSPFRMAILTSQNDNSCGEVLPFSTGAPTNYNGATYLDGPDAYTTSQYLRLSYAGTAINAYFPQEVRHCQFLRCGTAIAAVDDTDLNLRNVLFSVCGTAVSIGGGNSLVGQHVTADLVNKFFDAPYCIGYLTNSILTAVTNIGTNLNLYSCVTNASGAGIYQTVGAGSYYLVDGSTNRTGTTNIHAGLLAELRECTTYPPVLITTNFTGNTVLAARPIRVTNSPSIGFHYPGLDFVVSGRTVSANLTLTNGVALGVYGSSSSYGLGLSSGSLVSEGTPPRLNWIVRYNTVQEQSTTNWSASSVGPSVKMLTSSPAVRARFTGWSLLGGVGDHFNDTTTSTSLSSFRDSQFGGGKFTVYPGSTGLTNCLWQRVYVTLRDDGYDLQWYLFNNLFYGGTLYYNAKGNSPVLLAYDNLFDKTTITKGGSSANFAHDYNGYVTNQNRLSPNGAHDVILTNSPVYQTSHLGRFYYPTNDGMLSQLIDAGSRNATNAGLYYYTTTTNQVREANSVVDIGFHAAADLDGDGIPDYADSDADGDGMLDSWEVANGLNPLVNDASDDPDGDWITNINEYNGGTNSTNPRDVMVVAWGDNSAGQCNVPTNLFSARSVAGGLFHTLALQSNGVVTAWGNNTYGQTSVPPGLTNVISIAAGPYYGIAARANGNVTNWGRWWTGVDYPLITNVAGLTGVVQVAAGQDHALALRSNGSIIAWGYYTNAPDIFVPTNLGPALAVAATWNHSLALLTNGTVAAWGDSYFDVTNVPAGLSNVTAIACGAYHALALKSDGTITAWGAGGSNGTTFNFGQSIVPAGLSNVIAIAAGGYRSLALRADGTIVGWGDNYFGQGTAPPGVSNLIAIATGPNHTLAIRNGRQLPIVLLNPVNQAAPAGSNVTFTAFGLGLAGVHYQWQFNGTNIAGATNATLTLNNVQANNAGTYRVIISTGAGSVTSSTATFTLITPPVLVSQTEPERQWAPLYPVLVLAVNVSSPFLSYQWKLNGTPIAGQTGSNYYVFPFASSEERHYSVTVTNEGGITNSRTWKVRALNQGGVAAWGNDDEGELDWPVSATNVIAVAAGEYHSLALREDGTVAQWGSYWDGADYFAVGAPPAYSNLVAVAAGAEHDLGLTATGTVVSWGLTNAAANTVPTNLAGVKGIAAGWNHNVALLTNGTVTAWGVNGAELGWHLTEVPADLTNATAIAAGALHSLALRNAGTVAAWGYNSVGQTNVPAGLSNVVAIAAGGNHSLALKGDGAVLAWGLNSSGQCSVPNGLSNVMAIAAGWAHSVALKNDGTVVAWGNNSNEQTNVGAGLKWIKSIAAGGDHTLAAVFSSEVQYPVTASKDLLVIYNSTSTNSIRVKDYYLAHRPMASGANALGIGYTNGTSPGYYETITPGDLTNQVFTPLFSWLEANPTKRPTYVILFLDMPSRVNDTSVFPTNGLYPITGVHPSVSVQIHDAYPGIQPFVTHINMGDTNACRAYIDKLQSIGTNVSQGNLLISANAAGYHNTNYVVDNVKYPYITATVIRAATNGLLAAGVPSNSISYLEDIEYCAQVVTNIVNGETNYDCVAWETKTHLTNAVNVAGYISAGAHSSLLPFYAINGVVKWTGNSSWYIIETTESHNGMLYSDQGNFIYWFSANAFGGTNYSNTPVGAVSHVDEPSLSGVNSPQSYFNRWARGKNFGICAWNSRGTPQFQAVGDPLVIK